MSEFEFMFVIDKVDDAIEQVVVEDLQGFVGGHGRTTLLTIVGVGDDAVDAGGRLIAILRNHGVTVRRVYEDIVTRAQIAERMGVTRQGVGLWVRGLRLGTHPFPEPHVLGGGGLWLWTDVNQWLRDSGLEHDEVDYPTAMDIARLNTMLCPPNPASAQDDSVLYLSAAEERQLEDHWKGDAASPTHAPAP